MLIESELKKMLHLRKTFGDYLITNTFTSIQKKKRSTLFFRHLVLHMLNYYSHNTVQYVPWWIRLNISFVTHLQEVQLNSLMTKLHYKNNGADPSWITRFEHDSYILFHTHKQSRIPYPQPFWMLSILLSMKLYYLF